MTLRPATPEFVRLMRIARAHTPPMNSTGAMASQCPECGRSYPCATLIWATSNHDPRSPWDPSREEAQGS